MFSQVVIGVSSLVVVHCIFRVVHNDNQVEGIANGIECRMAKHPMITLFICLHIPYMMRRNGFENDPDWPTIQK